MTNNPDKRSEKSSDEKPKKEKKQKWFRVISVDDRHISFYLGQSKSRRNIDDEVFRTPVYRKRLVNQGYWIPSMDWEESWYTVNSESDDEDEGHVEGGSRQPTTESFEEKMKKLKAEQQGNFKKYYERKASKEKEKSRNSKSKVKRSKMEIKKDDGVKKKSDQQKVETVKKEEPKPQKTSVEKVKKVEPLKPQYPKKTEKTPTRDVREEKVKTQDPSKIEDPQTRNSKKSEDPPPKETVRSHYCYTEMHLVSGKEIKKK